MKRVLVNSELEVNNETQSLEKKVERKVERKSVPYYKYLLRKNNVKGIKCHNCGIYAVLELRDDRLHYTTYPLTSRPARHKLAICSNCCKVYFNDYVDLNK